MHPDRPNSAGDGGSDGASLDHCEGCLVLHVSEFTECTDSACTRPDRERHALVLTCDELLPACSCADELARSLRG